MITKAVVIGKPGTVVLKELADPEPTPSEVLLRPMFGGICGTDVHILEGNFLGKYPVIPCHEFSAEIIKVGTSVTNLAVGDSVVVDPNIRCGRCPHCLKGEINLCDHYEAVGVTQPGAFAELVCAPGKNVHTFKGISYSTAAFAEPLACVLYGQGRLNVEPGAKVLVWGAGAIGLLHLQICSRLRGARVVVVDKDLKRVELARQLGAKEAVLSDDSMDQALKKIESSGWDIVIEATGSVSVLNQSFRYLRRGGQALVFGVYAREVDLSIAAFDVFLNDWTIRGSFTYRNEFSEAVRILSAGLIDVGALVDLQIPIDRVPEILQRLAKQEKLGKVHVSLTA